MPQSMTQWLMLGSALLLFALLGTVYYYRNIYPIRLGRLLRHLRDSEERYRRLAHTTDVGIAVLDSDFHIVEWSPALEQLFGLRRSKAVGSDFFALCIFPEDQERLVLDISSHRERDDVFDLEFPVKAVNDERRLLRWRIRYYTDALNGRRYLTAVGHDVTELRTATFRLMVSEARFRQVFQAAPVGMALADPDGRVLTANQEYARFLGFLAPDDLPGKQLLDFTLPEDREDIQNSIRNSLRDTAGSYRIERRFVTKQGAVRWGQASGLMLEDDYGQRYLINQIADIHERKKAELALIESERRLATLIGNLSGAVYRYELPPGTDTLRLHHDQRPNFVSDGVEVLTGYPRSVFLRSQTALELSHLLMPEDRPRLEAALAAALQGTGSFQVVYRLRNAVTGVRWVSEQGRVWQRPDGAYAIDGLILDITTERQARESELVYRTLVADTETGFVSLSPKGVVLEANAPYVAMAGFDEPGEIVGRSILAWTCPEYEVGTLNFLASAMDYSHVRHFETVYLRQDGSRVNLLINAVAASGGSERSIKCLIFDISASKKAERELTEHRNQLMVAQRIARLGAWQWSFETHQLSLSDVFLELIAFPARQAPPDIAFLNQLIEVDDALRIREAVRLLMEHGEHTVAEFRVRTCEGERRFWRADATMERAPNGRRLRLVGTVQDVTESKQAEVALRASEARYRSLFDTNIDGIFFVSLDGVIEEGNAAFRSIVAYEDVRNLDCHTITPEEWWEADEKAWAQIDEKGWCDAFSKEYRRRDGSRVPISIRAWLVRNEHGQPLRVMCMVRDITELKRIEAEREQLQKGLQQAQKMEAIGQLTGGIAHDFNNILASILGYTDLALRREVVQQDVRVSRHLQEVKLAGERARELISQMLLFSRGGRNPGVVQSVSGLVQETVRMLRPTLPSTLRLRTYINQTLPAIRVEGVSMQQIVMNLVINARDAMEGRGEVQVLARLAEMPQARCSSCSQLLSGQFVEVAVRDHGPGIPEAVFERMFDPFFTTKPVGKGTGMGLSVVHGIVHEFGGHLVVETGAWGTTFRILFPIPSEAEQQQPVVKETPRLLGQGERVLVVDDEAPVAEMLGELLESHGYAVEVMTDSQQALRRLRQPEDPVDLLLTDLLMPGLDGVELIRLARGHNPNLPVVMMSGQAALLQHELMSWPVLSKPVDVPALLACLDNMLDSVRLVRLADLA